MKENTRKLPLVPLWVFAIIALLYISAVRVDVMDIDASQYAEMSREMTHSDNWLQLYDRGRDYLDKPPLLFWISALGMKIFGPTNTGFKLPSILLALLALYATYRLAKVFYGEATGRMAALVLGVCQGMFLMTNDVRTDTALTCWVTVALWCIAEGQVQRRWYHVLGGTAAIALGMMTKGPIALFVPLFAFGAHWVLRREWKRIFSPHHLLDMLLIAVFLIPMCIGLYQQYDLHPEKVMDGKTGTSGLRFFFWTQSFGRITGESPWDNGAGPDFLYVNMLWSFLPWILLFTIALVLNVVGIVRQRFRISKRQEWVSTGGFILTYLSLGLSHYQLPHYIFVAFPLAAIMVAAFLKELFEGRYPKLLRVSNGIQTGVGGIMLVAALLTLTVTFPAGPTMIFFWALAFGSWLWILFKKGLPGKLLFTSAAAAILTNFFLTHHFYHTLLRYQLGSQMGRYIRDNRIPAKDISTWQIEDPVNSVPFYARQVIPRTPDSLLPRPGSYVLTMQRGYDSLLTAGVPFQTVTAGKRFKVSELTPDFLSEKTRPRALSVYYFLRLQ